MSELELDVDVLLLLRLLFVAVGHRCILGTGARNMGARLASLSRRLSFSFFILVCPGWFCDS